MCCVNITRLKYFVYAYYYHDTWPVHLVNEAPYFIHLFSCVILAEIVMGSTAKPARRHCTLPALLDPTSLAPP